jgi:Trk-type K+ transport system membrane component
VKIFERTPGASALVLLLAAIVVIAGAIVTVANPQHFPFRDYVEDVTILAGALGVSTGIGAGIAALSNGKNKTAAPPPTAKSPEKAAYTREPHE